jgi:hypothetical protein
MLLELFITGTLVLALGLLAYWAYLAIPNWYVKKYRLRTKEELEALKKAWVDAGNDVTSWKPPLVKAYSPGTNRAAAVLRGNALILVLMGDNLKIGSSNFEDLRETGLFAFEERKGDEPQNEGHRSWISALVNAWVKNTTGYKILSAKLADFFSPEISLYEADLERYDVIEIPNFDMKKRGSKWRREKKPHDVTREFRPLTLARLSGITEEIDASKLMPTVKGDDVEDVPQRIPFVVLYEFTGELDNLVELIKKISGKFPAYIIDLINQGFMGATSQRGWDELQNPEVKKKICEEIGEAIREQLGEIGFSETKWSIQIADYFVTDPDVRQALNEQGIAFAKGTASVADALFRKKVAGIDMESDKLKAEGLASYGKLRLEGLAEGAKAINGVVRSHELTRDILVADRYSEGVEKANNGTIFVTAGGRGPMPVVDMTPDPSDK